MHTSVVNPIYLHFLLAPIFCVMHEATVHIAMHARILYSYACITYVLTHAAHCIIMNIHS